MSVSQALLGLLDGQPAHGYTLKKLYDEHFSRVKPLPYGQVYASLSRFERDGLATVVGAELVEGPERKIFAITSAGVTQFEDWLQEPYEPTVFAVSTLFTKITLAMLSGRSPIEILDAQRLVHLDRMRELNKLRKAAAGTELLALTYEITHLDADLRWIEDSGNRILKGKS